MTCGLLLRALWPLPTLQALGREQFQGLLPQTVETDTEFQGLPPPELARVFPVMLGRRRCDPARLRAAEGVGETCLCPPPCPGGHSSPQG